MNLRFCLRKGGTGETKGQGEREGGGGERKIRCRPPCPQPHNWTHNQLDKLTRICFFFSSLPGSPYTQGTMNTTYLDITAHEDQVTPFLGFSFRIQY